MLGRLNQNSLKFQLIVVIGMTALVSALLFSTLASRLSREQIDRDQSSLLQHVAKRMATQLAQDMNGRAQELIFITQLDQLRQTTVTVEAKQGILDRLQTAYPDYAWLGLMDTEGTIVASTQSVLKGASAAERPWFQEGLEGLHFGDAHEAVLLAKVLPPPRLDVGAMRVVNISTPVFDLEGVRMGVLSAQLSLDWAFEARRRMLAELERDQLELVLLNRAGEVLLGTPDMPARSVDLSGLAALQQVDDPGRLATIETWPDGQRYLTAAVADQGFHRFPGFGWTVVVRTSEERALAAAQRVQDMIAWGGLFIALLFATLLWWIVGRQLRPLERLSEAAQQLDPASGHAPALQEPQGNNEVAHFTRSLIRLVNALGESQERFRSLFQHAPVPLVHSGASGRLLAQNQRFEMVFGYRREDMSTLDDWWRNAFPSPDSRQRAKARWEESVQQAGDHAGMIPSHEFEVACKNGHQRTVEVSGFMLPDAGTLIAFHDITELRQAEAHARMWAESFEQAELGLMITHARTNTIAAVNPAFARERGYEREEMVGMNARLLAPPDRQPEVARIIQSLDTLNHGLFETEHLTRNGQRFPVLMDITVLRNDQGEATSRVTYALNLTERKRAEQALEQAQAAALEQQRQAQLATLQQMQALQAARKAAEEAEREVRRLNTELEQRVVERTAALSAANRELDSFAYTVSHDLRSPLRTMRGFSDILLHEYKDRLDEETRDCARRIALAGERMSELIEGILTLSGIARSSLRCDTVDLSSLATHRLAELAQAEPGRQVQVSVEPGLQTYGDTRMVDVLLTNLLDNAWKYTSKTADARIRVYSGSVNGIPGFCVKDNGAGFDMDKASRLFEPFQRMHRQDDFPGTGVGLATVQRIVQRHGGELCVQAEPGQGACFCFTLPHAPQAGTSAQPTDAEAASPRQ
jgi:PAS domain S-box-containing protein